MDSRAQIPEEDQADLSRSQFQRRNIQTTPSNTLKLAVGGIVIFIILSIFFYYQSKLNSQSKDIEQLKSRLGVMKTFQEIIKNKMIATQKQYQQHIRKEKRLKQESENLLSKIPKTTTKQKENIYLYKQDTRPYDRPKPEYSTPELEAISKFRIQKSGTMAVVNKTKSEVTFFKTNNEGKTIEQIIYNSEAQKDRISYFFKRISFIENQKKFQSLHLIKYNEDVDKSLQEERLRVETEEYDRVQEIHNLTDIDTELPMCLAVSGYSSNLPFGIQYNLNSIFTQNYSNYFVVIFNDEETGAHDQIFRKYLHFHNISKNKYAYVQNFAKKTPLEYLYIASHYYCSQDSILVTVEGDAQFIGKNLLSMYNAGYQLLRSGLVYSNFYLYQNGKTVRSGFTADDMIEGSSSGSLFSHIMSFRTSLFRRLQIRDLQNDKGQFYSLKDDFVLFFPMMRLACGRVNVIDGYHYLYNINAKVQDIGADINNIPTNERRDRNNRYSCEKVFDEMMKN